MIEEDIREAVERFCNVPYYFAQTAMGVDDGGFAALYDSHQAGEAGGRFASEIGTEVISYVSGRAGKEEFAAGTGRLFDMDAMDRFTFRLPDSPEPADLYLGAERVADATVAHLKSAFPSVRRESLADDRDRIRDFVLDYMKAEAAFAAGIAGPGRPAGR